MDKSALVSDGQALVRLLDDTSIKPKGAMWVYSPDIDIWKLWIVPSPGFDTREKHSFYQIVATVIANHRDQFQALEASDVELTSTNHPAVEPLKQMFRIEGLGSVFLGNNMVNGFYIPDGIMLRWAI